MDCEQLRLRVLFILKRYPWPMTHGANLRRLNFIKRLQHRFVFDLYCFADKPELPQELTEFFDKIICRPVPKSDFAWSGESESGESNADRHFMPGEETEQDLRGLLGSEEYQIAIASTGMLGCVLRAERIPVIGDIIDNDCLAIWRSMQYPNGFVHFFRQLRSFVSAAAYQRACFRDLSSVCYVSESDAAFSRWISRFPDHVVIPNGVDHAYFHPTDQSRERYAIVLEGNMGFPPNIDAARYFISQILPKIWRSVPEAHFYLVGQRPHPDVVALAADKVTVTGFVEDIRPWLNRAQVFVCPMRIGSGMKNKILQAWAMEIPIVATSISTSGLIVQADKNVVVRDGIDEFAQAVIELLQNPGQARSIGMAGRRTVEQYYSWDQAARQFGDLLEHTIKKQVS